MRRLFLDMVTFFHFPQLGSAIEKIIFAWSYDCTLATMLYRPSEVFKKFSFIHLLDEREKCACMNFNKFKKFCDPLTALESSSKAHTGVHVRTMDLNIIQHKELREALSQGLNHIPLQPTCITKALATVMQAFDQLIDILDLERIQFPIDEASDFLYTTCLDMLKHSSKNNKFGFKHSGKWLFDIIAVKNEIDWLLKHLYCSGLDKASNNACFICIRHIRLQALERLSGKDFTPCKSDTTWALPSLILNQVSTDLELILPECPQPFKSLPYLMATYKQHKGKYRWLTNAHSTIFSNIALLLTLTSNVILESFKSWAGTKIQGYKYFLNVRTSLFWMVDLVIDTMFNLPSDMHDVYVADISRCFETIPLTGPDNLLDAITFITTTVFKQAALLHPKARTSIWVRTDQSGTPARAVWATRKPQSGCWFELSASRLLQLHSWLMSNCFITLGDRVWRQCTGIPMGFSCSPIWCNMYLISYESKFIQRLAKLGRVDLMSKFQHAFRYIDDLCLFNVDNLREFLSHPTKNTG